MFLVCVSGVGGWGGGVVDGGVDVVERECDQT